MRGLVIGHGFGRKTNGAVDVAVAFGGEQVITVTVEAKAYHTVGVSRKYLIGLAGAAALGQHRYAVEGYVGLPVDHAQGQVAATVERAFAGEPKNVVRSVAVAAQKPGMAGAVGDQPEIVACRIDGGVDGFYRPYGRARHGGVEHIESANTLSPVGGIIEISFFVDKGKQFVTLGVEGWSQVLRFAPTAIEPAGYI